MKFRKVITGAAGALFAIAFGWAYLTVMLTELNDHATLIRVGPPVRTPNRNGAVTLTVPVTNLTERSLRLDAWMGELWPSDHMMSFDTNTLADVGVVLPRSVTWVHVPESIRSTSPEINVTVMAVPVASRGRRLLDRMAQRIERLTGCQIPSWRLYEGYRAPSGLVMLEGSQSQMTYSEAIQRSPPTSLALKSASPFSLENKPGGLSPKK